MSKYLNSDCVKPYIIQTESECMKCGMINGFLATGLVMLILSYFIYKAYDAGSLKKFHLISAGVLIFCCLIILPTTMSYGNRSMWLGYNKSFNGLVEIGIPKEEAMKIIYMGDYSGIPPAAFKFMGQKNPKKEEKKLEQVKNDL